MSNDTKNFTSLWNVKECEWKVEHEDSICIYLKYLQPDSDNPTKEWERWIKHQFVRELPIYGELKALATDFIPDTEIAAYFEQKASKTGKTFWDFVAIKPKSDYKPKDKTKKWNNFRSENHGAAAGGILHDAVSIGIKYHKEYNVNEIKKIAFELVSVRQELEDYVSKHKKDNEEKSKIKLEQDKIEDIPKRKKITKKEDEEIDAAIQEVLNDDSDATTFNS